MHDMLSYMSMDPIHRRHHHNKLTFRGLYMFTENFILPLSHDEVVYGKSSLLRKMPGDEWQRFANLRLLLGYMYAQPGKKLLFMGGEFGQMNEWYHDAGLDWKLLESPLHQGMAQWVRDLNRIYRDELALYGLDCEAAGFEWIDCNDAERSVISFLRKGPSERHAMLIMCNFTPVPRLNYRIGAPYKGFWREVLNSDAETYCGSGYGNLGGLETAPISAHGRPCSLSLVLPPLSAVFFRFENP
jgi:1,4-alpha-glucan branching enzyme